MNQMTSRERLLAAINGNEVDRLPWSPLVDYYFISSLDKEKDIIEVSKDFEFDLMERHVPTFSDPIGASIGLEFKNGVEFKTERKGNKIINKYITPVGEITELKETTEVLKYGFTKEHYVKNIKDLKIYTYVLENLELKSLEKSFIKRDEAIGDNGLAVPSGPLTPLQQMLQFLVGIEKTIYMIMDNPDEVKAFMELSHEINKECYKILSKYPSELIIAYEDTSTTVLSPNMYKEYCQSYIDDYAEIVQSNNQKYITHMCGKLNALKEYLAEGKMNGIDSICPPQTGDIWIDDARKALGEDKLLIGGIEPAALERMSTSETEKYVIDVIEKMKPWKNFILSTGDATPHGTPPENLMKVIELVKKLT